MRTVVNCRVLRRAYIHRVHRIRTWFTNDGAVATEKLPRICFSIDLIEFSNENENKSFGPIVGKLVATKSAVR